ncbi:MAG: sensor domain-containing diguanylate cyclase, partial [Nitrospirota bacterium]|nr:sensor domain-containing diguanylate cyclase [Nitrospirota bacterium]
VEDISSLILDYAKLLTDSEFGFVGYIDPQTGYLVYPTLTKDIWDKCQVKNKDIIFKKFKGLFGWVINNKKSLIANNPSNDPRSSGTPQGHLPIRRFLSAPALIGKTLVGQVAIANSSRNYTNKDLLLIERLSALYAIAVQRERAEETINQMAYHDSLTGLPNRQLFNDRFALALAQTKRNDQKLAVMILDLDNFKEVNDSRGHITGDHLLKDVGKKLSGLLRKTDTVARLGGDEFIILLPIIKRDDDSAEIAHKIMQAFQEPFVIDDQEIYTTTSIGIAIYPRDGRDGATLIKNADIAMYRAKEQGRNKYCHYTP